MGLTPPLEHPSGSGDNGDIVRYNHSTGHLEMWAPIGQTPNRSTPLGVVSSPATPTDSSIHLVRNASGNVIQVFYNLNGTWVRTDPIAYFEVPGKLRHSWLANLPPGQTFECEVEMRILIGREMVEYERFGGYGAIRLVTVDYGANAAADFSGRLVMDDLSLSYAAVGTYRVSNGYKHPVDDYGLTYGGSAEVPDSAGGAAVATASLSLANTGTTGIPRVYIDGDWHWTVQMMNGQLFQADFYYRIRQAAHASISGASWGSWAFLDRIYVGVGGV